MYWTTCLENVKDNDVVNISDDGHFEYYRNNILIIHGQMDNREEEIKSLLADGFSIVE